MAFGSKTRDASVSFGMTERYEIVLKIYDLLPHYPAIRRILWGREGSMADVTN
jgi:hypothetical protein